MMKKLIKTVVILSASIFVFHALPNTAYAEKSQFTAKQQRLIKLAREKRAKLEGARIRYEIRKEGIHDRNDRLRREAKERRERQRNKDDEYEQYQEYEPYNLFFFIKSATLP